MPQAQVVKADINAMAKVALIVIIIRGLKIKLGLKIPRCWIWKILKASKQDMVHWTETKIRFMNHKQTYWCRVLIEEDGICTIHIIIPSGIVLLVFIEFIEFKLSANVQ